MSVSIKICRQGILFKMKKEPILVVINFSKIKDGKRLWNHFFTECMDLSCLAGNINFFLQFISVKPKEILSFQPEQKLKIIFHVSLLIHSKLNKNKRRGTRI